MNEFSGDNKLGIIINICVLGFLEAIIFLYVNNLVFKLTMVLLFIVTTIIQIRRIHYYSFTANGIKYNRRFTKKAWVVLKEEIYLQRELPHSRASANIKVEVWNKNQNKVITSFEYRRIRELEDFYTFSIRLGYKWQIDPFSKIY